MENQNVLLVLSVITISTVTLTSNKGIKILDRRPKFCHRVTLYSDSCTLKSGSQTSWSKTNSSNSSEIIAVDGISNDKSKYRMYTDAYTCRLEINNFEPSDANLTYHIMDHFKTKSIRLDPQDDKIELPPSMNTTLISEFYEEGILYNITVQYSKVYPIPQCVAHYMFLDKSLPLENVPVQNITRQLGTFFASTHSVSLLIKQDGNFLMSCKIGESLYNIRNVTFVARRDGAAHDCPKENSILLVILTIVCTVVVTVLSIKMLSCYDRIKKQIVGLRSPKNPKPKPLMDQAMIMRDKDVESNERILVECVDDTSK